MQSIKTADLAAFYGLTGYSVARILRRAGVEPVAGGRGRDGVQWPRDEARRVLSARARRLLDTPKSSCV